MWSTCCARSTASRSRNRAGSDAQDFRRRVLVNQRETVADRGLEFLGLRVHRTVFPLAVALIVLAVTAALLDPAGFNASVARLDRKSVV